MAEKEVSQEGVPGDLSLEPTTKRRSVRFAHERVRRAILENELPAGAVISQVRLAEQLRISRTPLRESLRLLEREGLVESEVNHRVRVADVSMPDLEQLYAVRIQLESLGVRLTVPRLSDAELRRVGDDLAVMEDFARREDYEGWQTPHREFHRGLVRHSGERLIRMISEHSDHAERYRRIFLTEADQSWSRSMDDHRSIFEACSAREPAVAAERLARHYSVIALGVISRLAPEYDPVAVRTALQMATRRDV